VHVRDVLDAIATKTPGMLEKFGGHAMAAGMSLREKTFPSLSAPSRRRSNAGSTRTRWPGTCTPTARLLPGEFTVRHRSGAA
jgi:single-stranded-DNA-specific exonuclease